MGPSRSCRPDSDPTYPYPVGTGLAAEKGSLAGPIVQGLESNTHPTMLAVKAVTIPVAELSEAFHRKAV
ncbi:MAG: hypothetical protein RLZZ245_614 [Verrucomicrobiota bacterium]